MDNESDDKQKETAGLHCCGVFRYLFFDYRLSSVTQWRKNTFPEKNKIRLHPFFMAWKHM